MKRERARLAFLIAVALRPWVATAVPPYDGELLSHRTPPAIEQWQTLEVPLLFRNDGTRTWRSAGWNVSYHWLTRSGKSVVWDGVRTPLPHDIVTGETLEIKAQLRAPRGRGSFLLQWDVVEEGVTWLSEADPTPTESLPITILPGTLTHGFSLLHHETPRLLFAGETRQVTIALKNDGTRVWSPNGTINVSYHWNHENRERNVFDGERTALPEVVTENGEIELEARLRAPRDAGLYQLHWDMVHENVTWFSQLDPTVPSGLGVLVLPNPLNDPPDATAIALVCLGLAWIAFRLDSPPIWLIASVSVLDLAWFFIALLVKQSAILEEAGKSLVPGAGWVVASGVAALTITVALLPRLLRPWIVLALNAACSLLILADIVHFRFFEDVLSIETIGAAGQAGHLVGSIRTLLEPGDFWLMSDLLPGIGLALIVTTLARRAGPKPPRWLALCLSPLLVPAVLEIWTIAEAREGRFVQTFQNLFLVQELGVLNYHVFDVANELRYLGSRPELTETRREEIDAWFRSQAPRRAGAGRWFGVASGRNLLMLQIESMQGFVIGMQIDGQEITPNLNRWRESQALWFSNCSDQTAQGRTSDAELATQVSLIPANRGAVAFRFGGNRYEGIADILAAHGYETLSAIPFQGSFWNRRVTHPEFGFHQNLFDEAFLPGTRVGWGLNDRDFLMQMAPRLAHLDPPFGALLITLSNHHPYPQFPDRLKRLRLERHEGTALGNYLHSMHYFDEAFGAFLSELDRFGILDTTVIALWGDHTAGLPWNQELGDVVGFRATEPEFYRQAEVPLMIRIPGTEVPLPGERKIRCGQVDVAPTLLALLGIDPSPYRFLGRNLLGDPGNEPVVQRYGVWIDDELLYLPKGPELEAGRCYQLENLELVSVERCREGNRKAHERLQVSRDVIRYDLQSLVASRSQPIPSARRRSD